MDLSQRWVEAIEQTYRDIVGLDFVLPKQELLQQVELVSTPFSSGPEILQMAKTFFLLSFRQQDVMESLQDRILRGTEEEGEEEKVKNRMQHLKALDRLKETVREFFEHRLEVTKEKSESKSPLIRLIQILDLSFPEMLLIFYLALLPLETVFKSHYRDGMLSDISAAVLLDKPSVLAIACQEHPLVSKGIIRVESGFTANFLQYEISLGKEMVKLLWEFELSSEEFFNLSSLLPEEVAAALLENVSPTISKELEEDIGDFWEDEDLESEVPPWEAEEKSLLDEDEDEDGDEGEEGRDEDSDDELSLEAYLRHELQKESELLEKLEKLDPKKDEETGLLPYQDDLDYLEDHLTFLTLRCMIYSAQKEDPDDFLLRKERTKEAVLRELRARERLAKKRCEKRLAITREQRKWEPRLERLCRHKKLSEFEKNVLLFLVASNISLEFRESLTRHLYSHNLEVGTLIEIFGENLREKLSYRKFFYKNAPLVRGGIINIDTYLGDLLSATVDIDRRILDYLAGLETEFEELVEGSHLYVPKVTMDRVVLPKEKKELILNTVKSFPEFLEARKRLGFEEIIPYGNSIVMLFYGPSGTGKTMMANAIANYLGKRVLLVNYPSLGDFYSDEVLKMIFREATINNAIVFFDECEGIFESRDHNPGLSLLLTELERYEGIIIMATNRPQVIDEAMSRRITLAIEFPKPDFYLRQRIWEAHLPQDIDLAEDVNFRDLAMRYELTGGLIKNAIITALSLAVRDKSNGKVTITQHHLEEGAKLQLQRHLSLSEFDRKITPTHGLNSLVLPQEVRQVLEEIVLAERAKQVVYGQWGFGDDNSSRGKGISVLFHGPPGTGKTYAAEALGYELGRPLKMVNLAALLSKFVGETEKNIEAIFQEAKAHNSILFFDEADALFAGRTAVLTSTDRYANADVDLLLHLIEHFDGIVILTTNLLENTDPAFFRRFRYVVHFPMPDEKLRLHLWKRLLPDKAPLAEDVDLSLLAARYELSGGHIKNAILRAASRAALRESHRKITHQDLETAAQEEFVSLNARIGFPLQGSGESS